MLPNTMLSAAAALAAVLLLILAAARLARFTRWAKPPRRGAGGMRVQEALALDPRRRLLLVECDGRRLLLLTGPQDQIVGWLPERPS